MSSNCPVCYESYSAEEGDDHACRKLLCGDLICTSCIRSEIVDDTYYCPECGRDYHGKDVNDFSEFLSDLTSIESNSDLSPSSSSNDLLSATNSPSESNNYRENRRVSVRLPCIEPGCKNKAIAAGLCMFHASQVASTVDAASNSFVVKESKIAKNMEANSDLSDIYMSRGIFEKRKQTSLHPEDIMKKFKNQQRLELGEAMEILNTARNILSKEPNILRIEAPVIACGDIHGQFYDLLNLLEEGGRPNDQGNFPQYLFLGDYVDRGSFSCEVIFTLLALKIAYPDKIHLLRGNHESGSVSSHFGFKQECKRKYGVNVYHRALLVFQTMPIGAIISTAFGDIYACHGGLSPSLTTIEEIEAIDRFIEPEMNSGLLDILWSDPISENSVDEMGDEVFEEFLKVSWKPNPARGCSYCFGYSAVKEFLNKNGLVCIVRAHEVQADGFRRHFEPRVVENRLRALLLSRVSELAELEEEEDVKMISAKVSQRKPSVAEAHEAAEQVLKHEMITEKDFPPVITIFSAPNYCDRYGNKAAILHIDSALDGFRVIQYDCVEHPVPDISDSQTENYMDAIIVACPYMPSSFRDFVKLALQLGPDESLVGELEQYHLISKNSISSLDGPDRGSQTTPEDHDSDDDIGGPVIQTGADIVITKSISPASTSPPNPVKAHDSPRSHTKRKSLTINIVGDEGSALAKNLLLGDDDEAPEFIASKPKAAEKRANLEINVSDTPTRRDAIGMDSARRRSADSLFSNRAASMRKVFPDTYMQALASDSINEVHPEALTSFIQGAMNQKFFAGDEQDKAIEFQFPQKEMAAVSVSELRKRFDKAANGNVFSEFDNWRQNQADIVEEAAKAAAATPTKTGLKRMVTLTEYDKCHRFDEIMAKFGGSKRNPTSGVQRNFQLAVQMYESLEDRKENRRMSTGRIKTASDPAERGLFAQAPSSSSGPISSSPPASDSKEQQLQPLNRKKSTKSRRASSFDPKLAASMQLELQSKTDDEEDDDEYKSSSSSNHTPFSSPATETQNTKDEDPADKEVVFTSTEVLALRLMFSMFDRSGSATIEYEDLVAYAQETDDMAGIRDADIALDILDIDGDGKIGLLDFIHFASRLKKIHQDKVALAGTTAN